VKTLVCLALVVLLAAIFAPACSVGQGVGCVSGTLDVQDCWSGAFDLHPDFFAAVPTNSAALQIRIQHGIDYETFSDGLLILVDDVQTVRSSSLDQPLSVGLSPAVTPPGVPVQAVANPPTVHATLYLERTCPTQDVALYALDAVSLEPDGTCNRPEDGGMEPPLQCDMGSSPSDAGAIASGDAGPQATSDAAGGAIASTDAGPMSDAAAPSTNSCTDFQSAAVSANVAQSMIQFTALFDGNEAESNAAQRRTIADFDFYFADPRDICPGGLGPPPRCRGHVKGRFDFYFERGRPAQPFP
jgi:hypothetical protein